MTSTTAAVLVLLEGPLAEAHFELVDVDCAGIGTAAAAVRVFVELAHDHPIGGRIDSFENVSKPPSSSIRPPS